MTQLTGEFKETEVGYVPTEWNVAPLSTVSVKTVNRNPSNDPNMTFRYIDVSSVSNETFQVTGYSDILGKDAPSRARRVVKADDTIFATVRPYLMNIARIPENLNESICSTGFCVIRADTGKADSRFLYFCVVSHPFVQKVVERQRGSSYPAVRDKDILEQYIPLPPLDEQRRIAAVLTAIQDAIAAQEDVIAAARAFKRSLMHRLFTYGPGRVPAETKETEIGEIPSHWDVVTVDDVLNVKLGKMLSQKAKQGISPRPYMRNANVQWGYVDLNNVAEMDFSPNEQERFRLEKDDILVCEGGEVGRTAIWNNQLEECYYQKAIHRLRPKSKSTISPYYFLHYMTLIFLVRNVSVVEGARSTIAHIPVAKLKALPLALPHKSEQDQIVGAIGSIDAKIAAEEDRKAALDALFKSMLHQLMTGQIRLLEDEELLAQGL